MTVKRCFCWLNDTLLKFFSSPLSIRMELIRNWSMRTWPRTFNFIWLFPFRFYFFFVLWYLLNLIKRRLRNNPLLLAIFISSPSPNQQRRCVHDVNEPRMFNQNTIQNSLEKHLDHLTVRRTRKTEKLINQNSLTQFPVKEKKKLRNAKAKVWNCFDGGFFWVCVTTTPHNCLARNRVTEMKRKSSKFERVLVD